MKILLNNVTDISKTLIELFVRKSDTAIDMTMGNGNDTLLLSECTGDDGFVYAFLAAWNDENSGGNANGQ